MTDSHLSFQKRSINLNIHLSVKPNSETSLGSASLLRFARDTIETAVVKISP